MRVYVIRHGESETNHSKKWTGWLDVHLTEQGVKEAKKVGDFIKDIHFDKIYTSDLVRAMETMQNALPERNYEKSPLLREINVGTLANRDLSILTAKQQEDTFRQGYIEFSGEGNIEFYNRIKEFQKELEQLEAEKIAVFSHAGWMRGFLDIVVNTKLHREAISCTNCAVAIFEYSNMTWKLHSSINLQ